MNKHTTPCCCNCKYQFELMCHPSNKNFGKGSITEPCGYVCTMQFADLSNLGKALFFENQHGVCGLHGFKSVIKIEQ